MGSYRIIWIRQNLGKTFCKIVVLAMVLSLQSCIEAPEENPTSTAEAVIYLTAGDDDTGYTLTDSIFGVATFTVSQENILKMELSTIVPLKNPYHAVHLHEGTCESPGMHWNGDTNINYCRYENIDGNPWSKPKAGDVGNLKRQDDSLGFLNIETDLWSLKTENKSSILGKVLVVHEDPEDFVQECYEDHNHKHNNAKIACGKIILKSID